MHISLASIPGGGDGTPGRWIGATPSVVVVLDGVEAAAGTADSPAEGCGHGTGRRVSRLGPALLHRASTEPARPLPECLDATLDEVAAARSGGCDCPDAGAVGSAVAALRQTADAWEHLVIGDCLVVMESVDGIAVVADDRPDSSGWTARGAVTGHRNRTAFHRAALLTEGASALIETYQDTTWRTLLDLLDHRGAPSMLQRLRSLEAEDPTYAERRSRRTPGAAAAFVRPDEIDRPHRA